LKSLQSRFHCRLPLPTESEARFMTGHHPFHNLLPQHSLPLRRRALNLTKNAHRADDLVQATFLKAWVSRDSFNPDTNLRAWLFTILRNTFLSELRKHRREVEDVDGAYARALSDEARQEHVLSLNELISAIDHLPDLQRQPLIMMGAYGFSQLEAANACGCTVGTIKSRVSRGRATLERIMSPDRASVMPSPQVASRTTIRMSGETQSGAHP
jgi:RNA polymerase sigma-70 factor (ECF subfamily)